MRLKPASDRVTQDLTDLTMVHRFQAIDKKVLEKSLKVGSSKLISPPTSLIRTGPSDTINPSIRSVVFDEDEKLAPFLCCALCKNLFVWYKHDGNKWVNQSGMASIKVHLRGNCSGNIKQKQISISRAFEVQGSSSSRKTLPQKMKESFRDHVVDVLCDHPTVSVNACADIASKVANFACEITHMNNTTYDFSIGRTCITTGLLHRGAAAHIKLQSLLSHIAGDQNAAVSLVMDYWSGKHDHRLSYGGIMACGLTSDWKWFCFPIFLSDLQSVSHDSAFTYKLLCDSILSCNATFSHPPFVCTDNEAKMVAAFDGRYESDTINLSGRIGCVEHALSICIQNVFDKSPSTALEVILKQLTSIETFYNCRDDRAKTLPRAIPSKSVTRPWRFHHTRISCAVENYTAYLNESDNAVTDNLPSLGILKALLEILKFTKSFFDRLEIDGVTSHLSFLNYISLDVHLFQLIIDEATPQVSRTVCIELRNVMQQKLWPYCGSYFAQSAAYFSGINIPRKIESLMEPFLRKSKQEKDFAADWLLCAKNYTTIVESYLTNLSAQIVDLKPTTIDNTSFTSPLKIDKNDVFNDLFTPPMKRQRLNQENHPLKSEMERYEAIRVPTLDIASCWKESVQFPTLQFCARILLSVPVSSAMVERLFSQSGLLLSRMRRNMRPCLVSAVIYNRYSNKLHQLISDCRIDVDREDIARYLSKVDEIKDEDEL